MEQSTFADLKRSLVDALVQSGLAGSAGDMTECQAHEVAEVAARIAWPLSREVVHLQKDNAGWRQRVEGLEATLETARNSAVEDIRLLDQLRRDRAAAESSRRDWAAEAARLQAELDDYTQPATWDEPHPFKDNGYGDPELGAPGNCDTCGRIQDEPEHEPPFGPPHLRPAANAPCSCISDDQATHLGSGFSRPVCAVHEEANECPAQTSGEADDCLCDDPAACGERYARRWHPRMGRTDVEGGAG